MKNYGIKEGYKIRKKPVYFEGDVTGTTIWQPDVYATLVTLARKCGADTIIDIGAGSGDKLIQYKNEFKFVAVDFGPNIKMLKKNLGTKGNQFIDQDFEKGFPTFSKATLERSVVVCSDVIEHIIKPDTLIKGLVTLSKTAPFVIISTPDRLRTRGVNHYGPAENQTHVREWSMEELDTLFRASGMKNLFTGITRSNDYEQVRRTIAIVAGTYPDDLSKKPSRAVDLQAIYSTKHDFAQSYYQKQGINLTKEPTKSGLRLKNDEWLVAPNPLTTTGAVISDAISKGYSTIEAQVIEIDPPPSYSWPEAGLIRQGHGLIGELKEVRALSVGGSKASTKKVYPLQLTIFRTKSPRRINKVISSISLKESQIIDTGHLNDDFLLETLAGWKILEKSTS